MFNPLSFPYDATKITTIDEPETNRTMTEVFPESIYFDRVAFKAEFMRQCYDKTQCRAEIDTDLFILPSIDDPDHVKADAYMSFVQFECGQTLEQSKHKYEWSLVIVCLALLIIWVYMRNLNTLKLQSDVNHREYALDHINADEFSVLLQIN
jgi:hypothetical protein